jgi:hypothetical protein
VLHHPPPLLWCLLLLQVLSMAHWSSHCRQWTPASNQSLNSNARGSRWFRVQTWKRRCCRHLCSALNKWASSLLSWEIPCTRWTFLRVRWWEGTSGYGKPFLSSSPPSNGEVLSGMLWPYGSSAPSFSISMEVVMIRCALARSGRSQVGFHCLLSWGHQNTIGADSMQVVLLCLCCRERPSRWCSLFLQGEKLTASHPWSRHLKYQDGNFSLCCPVAHDVLGTIPSSSLLCWAFLESCHVSSYWSTPVLVLLSSGVWTLCTISYKPVFGQGPGVTPSASSLCVGI